ncbi:MAG TPA: hypothetical protein VGO70_02135 [Arsenicitalea sp.]|nr:hypothetical protein [Arsenicitalea sp.]
MQLIKTLSIVAFVAFSAPAFAQDAAPAANPPAANPPAAAAPAAPAAEAPAAPAPKAPAPEGVSKEADQMLWCGQAFSEAGGQIKAGGDAQGGATMVDMGAKLIAQGSAALTAGGFANDKVETTKSAYAAQVSKEFAGGPSATRFSFEECKAIVK